jgi:hypothetical protein
MRTGTVLLVAWCTVGAAALSGQSQGSTPAPEAAQSTPEQAQAGEPAAQQPAGQVSPDTYTYQPDGRRDPFLNLLGTGAPAPVGRRGEGAAGLAVAEIIVRGVVQARGELLAMIQGPDNKTYIVHEGAKFVDGTVRSVTPQGLVIIQDVNDPLSLVKQREIQKLLRSQASAKE